MSAPLEAIPQASYSLLWNDSVKMMSGRWSPLLHTVTIVFEEMAFSLLLPWNPNYKNYIMEIIPEMEAYL